jgi:hypothetical protein
MGLDDDIISLYSNETTDNVYIKEELDDDNWKSVLSESSDDFSSENDTENDDDASINSLQAFVNTEIKVFCQMVREHLEKNVYYIFRSIRIDGIYCSIVIYNEPKIICVESVRVLTYNTSDELENYCLCHETYDTIEDAIETAKSFTSFKMYDGNLYSDINHIMLTLEENIIPFMSNQVCTMCKTRTQDTTICGHYICFHCRESCLFSGIKNCQKCGKDNVLHIYNNDENAITNTQFPDLVHASSILHNVPDIEMPYDIPTLSLQHSAEYLDVENMEDEPIENIVAKDIHGVLSNLPPKYNDIYLVIGAVVVTELVSFFLILFIHNFNDYLFS